MRYNTDGTRDNSFGQSGIQIIDVNSSANTKNDVALQADGKIVVVCTYADQDFCVIRLTSGGFLDPSFGGDGIVTTNVAGIGDAGIAVAIQADGKIVAGGEASGDFAAIRYLEDGSLDDSFNNSGIALAKFGGSYDYAGDLLIQPDGKILMSGYSDGGQGRKYALARFNSDGSLDDAFNHDGMLKTIVGFPNEVGRGAIALQSDGKILYANNAYYFSTTDQSTVLLRFTEDGKADKTFGTSGAVITDYSSNSEHYTAIAVQADQKIVTTGSVILNTTDYVNIVHCYLSDGVTDSSFGTDGTI